MQIVVSLGGVCKLLALSKSSSSSSSFSHHVHFQSHSHLFPSLKLVNVIPIAKGSLLFSVEKADYNVKLQPGNCQHWLRWVWKTVLWWNLIWGENFLFISGCHLGAGFEIHLVRGVLTKYICSHFWSFLISSLLAAVQSHYVRLEFNLMRVVSIESISSKTGSVSYRGNRTVATVIASRSNFALYSVVRHCAA